MNFPLGKSATMARSRAEQPPKSLFQEILATLSSYRRTSPRRRVLDRRFGSSQKLTQTEQSNPSFDYSPKVPKQSQMIVLGNKLRTRSIARLGDRVQPDLSLKDTVQRGRIARGRPRNASKTLSCIGIAVKVPF